MMPARPSHTIRLKEMPLLRTTGRALKADAMTAIDVQLHIRLRGVSGHCGNKSQA
jgi:hypothetical protein